MTVRLRLRPVPLALTGAVAAALAWYALASATGLIFHLMPAGPTLAAAWALRWSGGGLPIGSRIIAVAAGASISLAMTLLLAGEGRPLDEPVLTGLAIVAGVMLGGWLLRAASQAATS